MKVYRRLLMLGVVVAVIALACGGGESIDRASGDLSPAEFSSDDPVAEGSSPKVSDACLAGAADCDDVPGNTDEPLFIGDEPRFGTDPGAGVSGMVVDDGLSIADALATDATGPIAVQGFVVADDSGIRLCDALAESYPPQCGGDSIEVGDLTTVDPDELNSAQGVMWTDHRVTIIGEIIDGVLVPTPMSL